MAKVHIYSAKACPFAHRTRLVLEEKSIVFELTEVDLQNKPASYSAISLYGKVPAIEHEGRRIWESAVINEYLEEVFPAPPLLPKDPGQRAFARIWIDYANTRLAPAFTQVLRPKTADEEAVGRKALGEALALVEREALAKLAGDGPYWFGAEVSLVDLTFYPWFERWAALDRLRGFPIPAELTLLRRWREAVQTRRSAQAIANSTEFYLERYAKVAGPPRAAST